MWATLACQLDGDWKQDEETMFDFMHRRNPIVVMKKAGMWNHGELDVRYKHQFVVQEQDVRALVSVRRACSAKCDTKGELDIPETCFPSAPFVYCIRAKAAEGGVPVAVSRFSWTTVEECALVLDSEGHFEMNRNYERFRHAMKGKRPDPLQSFSTRPFVIIGRTVIQRLLGDFEPGKTYDLQTRGYNLLSMVDMMLTYV
jgi:hypothetical protein